MCRRQCSFREIRLLAGKILISAFILLPAALHATPLSGIKVIGPTGDYATITAALADVRTQTLGGALVLELQTNYAGGETFPLTFSNLTTTISNTLTLRPQIGASGLVISSALTTLPTIDLNGARFITIDGRPGGFGSNAGTGVGTASKLTIANTSSGLSLSAAALRFINEASSNILRYVTFRGASSISQGGVILFSTTTGPNGNDNNVIDHCDIRGNSSSSVPINCIYASGSGAPRDNSGNVISSCNIYDFYSAFYDQYGIRLDNGNTDWTIAGNNINQNTTHNGPSGVAGGIFINNSAGNNFIVASNAMNGWPYFFTTNSARFIGIALNVGTVTPSSVQGNLIKNFYWFTTLNTATGPGIWGGITVSAGSVNIGTVNGNTIGPNSVFTSGQSGLTTGISSSSAGVVTIANNSINNITVNGTKTNVSAAVTGIQVTAGTNAINNNTVSVLVAASAATIGYSQQVIGIYSSSTNSTSITGNTVNSLINYFTGSGSFGQIFGIYASGGVNTVIRNIVGNFTSKSPSTDDNMLGIAVGSQIAGQKVLQNTVHSFANSVVTAAVRADGISYSGPANGTNLVAGNKIQSLAISSTNTSSGLFGIRVGSGAVTVQNNIVCVGLSASGSGTASAGFVWGIYDGGVDAGRNFFHNSVYLGGTQVSGSVPTAAFYSGGSGNARVFENNIFVNARSRSFPATGKHYAVRYSGTDLTGLTANGNIFLAPVSYGMLGYFNGDLGSLAAWQAATGQDANSLFVDPLYINPAGNADLHIATNSPAINAGLPIGVTDDFDGDLRSLLTPTIGADELQHISNIPSELTDAMQVGNGAIGFNFTNISGASFTVFSSTNAALPMNQWINLGYASEIPSGSGQYQFTDLQATNNVQRFYRVRSP